MASSACGYVSNAVDVNARGSSYVVSVASTRTRVGDCVVLCSMGLRRVVGLTGAFCHGSYYFAQDGTSYVYGSLQSAYRFQGLVRHFFRLVNGLVVVRGLFRAGRISIHGRYAGLFFLFIFRVHYLRGALGGVGVSSACLRFL